MRGVMAKPSEAVVAGTYSIAGNASLKPRADELDVLLPLILGGPLTAGVGHPALYNTEFANVVDRGTKVYTYPITFEVELLAIEK